MIAVCLAVRAEAWARGKATQRHFAAVGRILIAIAKAGFAGGKNAGSSDAGSDAVSKTASTTTGATMISVGLKVGFAPVGGIPVAIGERTRASRRCACRGHASGSPVGGRASMPACATMSRVEIEVDLAAVGDDAVAIRVARVTGRNAARSLDALPSSVSDVASVVATAAMVGVRACVGFASVGR